jgi:hypothetical protein
MKLTLFGIMAVGAAFALLTFSVRSAQRRLPPIALPVGENMPATALQRLAAMTLAITLLLTIAAVALVAYNGADVFRDDDTVRLTTTGLLLAALGAFAIYNGRVWRWTVRDDGPLDERDRLILAAAHAGQAPAMIVTLAVWMIALTETYRSTQLIPSVFLYLIFWSLLMVSVLSSLAGVVMGYRRS